MSMKDQLTVASRGKAILFVGAGGTLDCTNYDFTELPTANPLLSRVNSAINRNFTHLPTAATKLAKDNISAYYQLITSTYTVLTVPEELVELLRFNWQKVYTTNYDNAIEIACRNAQVEFRSYVPSEKLDQSDKRRPIIHLHGFVERFTPENILRDCILDFNSNVANSVYEGYWGAQFKNDVVNCDVLVFLGYSLYDPEIPKLLRASGQTSSRVFFVNSHQENEELTIRQSEFGYPSNIGREGLAKITASASKQGQKRLRERFTCFDRPQAAPLSNLVSGQQKLEQHFLFGNRDSGLLAQDAREGTQNYVIRPKIVDKVLEVLPRSNFITIYSNLGYGKSVAARYLLEIGYHELNRPTFLLRKDQPELVDELEYICRSFENPLIIVEDIVKFRRHWYKFSHEISKRGSIVATSRFNIFESSQLELEAAFVDLNPIHIRIEGFDPEERNCLVPLISQASLLGG